MAVANVTLPQAKVAEQVVEQNVVKNDGNNNNVVVFGSMTQKTTKPSAEMDIMDKMVENLNLTEEKKQVYLKELYAKKEEKQKELEKKLVEYKKLVPEDKFTKVVNKIGAGTGFTIAGLLSLGGALGLAAEGGSAVGTVLGGIAGAAVGAGVGALVGLAAYGVVKLGGYVAKQIFTDTPEKEDVAIDYYKTNIQPLKEAIEHLDKTIEAFTAKDCNAIAE